MTTEEPIHKPYVLQLRDMDTRLVEAALERWQSVLKNEYTAGRLASPLACEAAVKRFFCRDELRQRGLQP